MDRFKVRCVLRAKFKNVLNCAVIILMIKRLRDIPLTITF